MATVYNSQPINKHTSWGGDFSTMGLPVSGFRIEEFIKNSLKKRIGYIYDYAKAEKYLAFTDEEDFNTWAEGKNLESNDPLTINNYLQNNLIIQSIPYRKEEKEQLQYYTIKMGNKTYSQLYNIFRITNDNTSENESWILEYPKNEEVSNAIDFINQHLELRLGPFNELVNIEEDLTPNDIIADEDTIKVDLHTLVSPGEEIIIKIIN